MTTLKNLKGTAIQFLDADPVLYVGSWASVSSLNTARDNGASMGTTTAALAAGGQIAPGITANSETWNGTAWTEGNNLNTARSHFHGAGVYTSAVVVGGESPLSPAVTATVEEWSGVDTNETITVS